MAKAALMVQSRNPFAVLGVSPDANKKTIMAAYWTLARRYSNASDGGSPSQQAARIAELQWARQELNRNLARWQANAKADADAPETPTAPIRPNVRATPPPRRDARPRDSSVDGRVASRAQTAAQGIRRRVGHVLVAAALVATIAAAWVHGAAEPIAATESDAVTGEPATADAPAVATSAVPPRTTSASAQGNARYPFLEMFNADLAGTYAQTGSGGDSTLTVDAKITGDLTLNLHFELGTSAGADQRQSVTLNTMQLTDPETSSTVCAGQLTSFSQRLRRATCDGNGPYQGVQITIDLQLGADPAANAVTGSLTGTMQRGSQ